MKQLLVRLFGPWVHGVDGATLRADALAGVLGALLVLPQGFAFAALAGLPGEYGLYTALVPCVVAALFGSSWHVMSGPTNALSLALLAGLAPLALAGSPAYLQLVFVVTLLVGVMQWLIGALRIGGVANFISPSALRGFTSGAAGLIALYALIDVGGLTGAARPGAGALLAHLAGQLQTVHAAPVIVTAATLGVILLLRHVLPRSPYALIGLVAGTGVAWLLNRSADGQAVVVLGAIPSIWPPIQWPNVPLEKLPDLLSIAFAITIVALGQSISIAKAVAARSGQLIDANREFRGQGLSNIAGSFFSSYVSCGSLNRSMPMYDAGARTPLAAVFASGWLLVLVAGTASLLALIPKAAIAAVLLLVAWTLFDLAGWRRLWHDSREDFVIAAVTAAATVTVRIEMAILLGTMLSLVVFLHRTSRPHMRVMGFDAPPGTGAPERQFVVRADVPSPLPECPQLKMVRMEGEVYFGAVPHVADHLREMRSTPDAADEAKGRSQVSSTPPAGGLGQRPGSGGQQKHLLVMCKSMNFIDLAAAELWQSELRERRAMGGDLYFHRPRPQVVEFWRHTGFDKELGPDHVFPTKRAAIATIFERLDRAVCAMCTARVFEECARVEPPPRQSA